MPSRQVSTPSFVAAILGIATLMLAICTIVWGIIFRMQDVEAERITGAVTAALTTTGGLGAILIMAIRYRKQQLEERQEKRGVKKEEIEKEEEFNSNFTRYVTMISTGDVESITGGLWGLSVLSDQYASYKREQHRNIAAKPKQQNDSSSVTEKKPNDLRYWNLSFSHATESSTSASTETTVGCKKNIKDYERINNWIDDAFYYIPNLRTVEDFNQKCVNVICSLIRSIGSKLESEDNTSPKDSKTVKISRKNVEAVQFTAISVIMNHVKIDESHSPNSDLPKSSPFHSENPWSNCYFDFHETTFWCPLRIEEALFLNRVEFWGCTFERAIYAPKSIFCDVNFNATQFKGPRTLFKEAIFIKTTIQGNCSFRHDFNLENAYFLSLPKFYDNKHSSAVNTKNGRTEIYFKGTLRVDTHLRFNNVSFFETNEEKSNLTEILDELCPSIENSKYLKKVHANDKYNIYRIGNLAYIISFEADSGGISIKTPSNKGWIKSTSLNIMGIYLKLLLTDYRRSTNRSTWGPRTRNTPAIK